jgi:serine/threonine-protein kinase
MSDVQADVKRLVSTLLGDQMPTLTWRPPILSRQDGDSEAEISEWYIPRLLLSHRGGTGDPLCDLVVDQIIGSGGLGVVHAAEQTSLHRNVAIKRVRPDRKSVAAEAQLRREAYLMGQLEHPAIPPVYIIGEEEEQCILVMRWVQGTPWDQKLAAHDVASRSELLQGATLRGELRILIRIGEAIAFAHEKKILHRDIKPSNVIVGEYGEVYLLDWGISVELDENGVFEARAFAGTPAFAAPEMLGYAALLDERTDVYLIGATLYNIVTGRPPHPGETVEEVFHGILTSPAPDLKGDWPEAMAMLCRKSMAADPADRYASVRALLEDLRYVIEFGEITDQELACDRDLETLIEMLRLKDFDSVLFDEIGTRCRFGFERILHEWPGNSGVARKLSRCLLLLCDADISRQRMAVARAMLSQYRKLATGIEAEQADILQQRLDAMAD